MLRHIVYKELLDTVLGLRFLVIFAACLVLILLSVLMGVRNYQGNLGYYQASTSMMKDTVENQVSYEALGVWGNYKIYKRPPQLGTLVEGLEGELGRNTVMSIYDEPQLDDTKFNEEPIYAVFGTLDLAFTVKVVVSLFAILLTFDAVCGERERGTLKLMLANSVPRDSVILGKLIGSFLGLMLPLAAALLLGGVVLAFVPQLRFSSDDLVRIGLLFVLIAAYVAVFLTVGVLVSSLTARSSTSFLVLLVIWVLFVLVVPKVSVNAAAILSPVASGAEIEARKQEINRQWYRESFAETEKWLREHPERQSLPRNEQIPREVVEEISRRLQERAESQKRRIEEDYVGAQKRRLSLAMWLSRISPTSSFSHAAMTLAQTDIVRQERFLQGVKDYRRQFQDYIQAKLREERRNRTLGGPPPSGSKKIDVSDMPTFSFTEEPLDSSLQRMIPDLGILVLFACLFFTGAFVAFLRYDVR